MGNIQSRKEKIEKLKFFIVSHSYPNYISQYDAWQKCESPDFINIKEKIGLEVTCSDAQEYCEWNGKKDKPEVFFGTDNPMDIISAYDKKCKKLGSASYQNNIKSFNLEKMYLYISSSYHTCVANDGDTVDSLLEDFLDDFKNCNKYQEFTYDCVFVELLISDTNSKAPLKKNLICFDFKENRVIWEQDDIQSYEEMMFGVLTKNEKV